MKTIFIAGLMHVQRSLTKLALFRRCCIKRRELLSKVDSAKPVGVTFLRR